MTTDTKLSLTDRFRQLLQTLGIEKAHFASRGLAELTGMAAAHPEMFASLTLVCPGLPNKEAITPLAERLLVFKGDNHHFDDLVQFVNSLPGAQLETLHGYANWSDIVARHTSEIEADLLPFLASQTAENMPQITGRDGERGAAAGITYHIQGSGPPLFLLPLGFTPTQWDAILPALTKEYATITLGGAEIGVTALLEKRATLDGYIRMVKTVIEETAVQPGDAILEVGCGTGALTRWLSHHTGGRNPITGVDINQYLLREAENLAHLENLDGQLTFESGNAEALSYPDNSFDVVFSVTVMEEVHADRMLAEMIRITKPGGRVAVIVRACDIPFFINMPLEDGLKAKIENPKEWVVPASNGCADRSLYSRFQESGLTKIKMFPYLSPFNNPWIIDFIEGSMKPSFTENEVENWTSVRAQTEAAGTFIFCYPHHCATGTKTADPRF